MIRKVFVSSLLISAAFYSSPSLAGWENLGETTAGDTFYVNFETIKKNNGYVYYWFLIDYLRPNKWNDMSSKTLMEADCNIPQKERKIYATYHTQPMGNGEPSTVSPEKREWRYPSPNTMEELKLKIVCDRF
jgi:hypothetical protein